MYARGNIHKPFNNEPRMILKARVHKEHETQPDSVLMADNNVPIPK
jgi:hypothetical protein